MLREWEPRAREIFSAENSNYRADYLHRLGLSQTGLDDFSEAETNLLDAHRIFSAAKQHQESAETASALASLYEAWHAKDARQGFDLKAAEWKRLASGE